MFFLTKKYFVNYRKCISDHDERSADELRIHTLNRQELKKILQGIKSHFMGTIDEQICLEKSEYAEFTDCWNAVHSQECAKMDQTSIIESCIREVRINSEKNLHTNSKSFYFQVLEDHSNQFLSAKKVFSNDYDDRINSEDNCPNILQMYQIHCDKIRKESESTFNDTKRYANDKDTYYLSRKFYHCGTGNASKDFLQALILSPPICNKGRRNRSFNLYTNPKMAVYMSNKSANTLDFIDKDNASIKNNTSRSFNSVDRNMFVLCHVDIGTQIQTIHLGQAPQR